MEQTSGGLKIASMVYSSSLTDICEINSSFDSGVLMIAYPGKNRNQSYISKEAFERSLPTIKNCPVVCNYDRESNSFGGHDVEVVSGTDGVKIVNITTPVGVVPESAKQYWKEVTEEDGTVREYICTDVLIWKRQEAYDKIKKDGVTAHSMEIKIKNGSKQDDGLYHIEDFEFTALTLIEVEPCFESSALKMFAKESFDEQFRSMMEDYKLSFNLISTSFEESNIHPQTDSTKGGNCTLEDNKNLNEDIENVETYSEATSESDDNSINSENAICENDELEVQAEEPSAEEPVEEEENEESDNETKFELSKQERDFLKSELSKYVDRYGCDMYFYEEHDPDINTVYFICADDWKLYGATYTKDGDNYTIDFENKSRKKYAIVDYVEGEPEPLAMSTVGEFVNTLLKDSESVNASLDSANSKMSEMSNELESLKEFKADVEAKELASKRNKIFEKFSDLSEVDEFVSLQESVENYGLEELEEKCYALRGKYGTFSLSNTNEHAGLPRIKASVEVSERMPYGGIVEHYLGNKN